MTQRHIHTPPPYRKEVQLLDGSQITIRPVSFADKNMVMSFFQRLTPDTVFLRFHYFKRTLTERELEDQCNVDYYDTYVLVAEKERNGQREIVGMGSYDRLKCFDAAEVAFVVEDDEQGKGIGTILLEELAMLGREKWLNTFVAELQSENAVMLNIFRKYRPSLKQVADGGSYQIVFTL